MAELSNDLDKLRKRLSESAKELLASAATPRERLERAVKDRNPDGHTEVLAADVLAVLGGMTEEYTLAINSLAKATVANLQGAGGAQLPEHKAKAAVFHPQTKLLLELLDKTRGAA